MLRDNSNFQGMSFLIIGNPILVNVSNNMIPHTLAKKTFGDLTSYRV